MSSVALSLPSECLLHFLLFQFRFSPAVSAPIFFVHLKKKKNRKWKTLESSRVVDSRAKKRDESSVVVVALLDKLIAAAAAA